jgi:D-alanine-D-alanine ligase
VSEGKRRKLKVLALFDVAEPTTIDRDLSAELKTVDWQTEADVLKALRSLGHTVEYLTIFDDLDLLRRKIEAFQPDVIFNLADEFKNNRAFDQNIVSYLELHDVPFTGCGSTALTLCKHKAISKKILGYHGIRVPEFATVAKGDRPARPRRLKFPILVKPIDEEGSLGIAQASFVETDEQFKERVQFIHDSVKRDAIAEEYIEGRELYVSVLGDKTLQVFPIRELVFREVPPDEPKIATFKAKWDEAYRKKWGLQNRFAESLDPKGVRAIERTCRRIYRLLTIDAYGRVDLRLTPAGEPVFIEANPNPILAADEDFAQSAAKAGIAYPKLIARIVRLGLGAIRG